MVAKQYVAASVGLNLLYFDESLKTDKLQSLALVDAHNQHLYQELDAVQWAEAFVLPVYCEPLGQLAVLCVAYDGIFGHFACVFTVSLALPGHLDLNWSKVVEGWRRQMLSRVMRCYEEWHPVVA